MTIIFNQDGSIRYLELGEYVQKGNHNVDLIQVGIYGQDITSDTVTAQFQLPDESTNQILITTTGTVDYGDTTINVRKFYLTNAQTVFAGVLKMSIQVVNAQGKTLYTYLTRLTINESTALADSTTITQEEYNEIVTALAGKQGIYVSSNVRAYATRTLANADLTNLAENQVVFILENSLLHSYMVQSGAFVPYEIYGSGSGGTGDYDYLAHIPQITAQNKLNIDYIDDSSSTTNHLMPKLPNSKGDGIYSLFAVKENGVVSYQWQVPTYDGDNE